VPRFRTWRFWSALTAFGLVGLLAAGLLTWREDILQALLDPKLPYAVYRPPPPPDYRTPDAWALAPPALKSGDPPVDVFFVHPTTFDGGRNWNGAIGDGNASRLLRTVMLPNYAGPFARAGRVFAPRYRQASLFTSLSLFDDAIEAREFAYGDIRNAFDAFLARSPANRPIIIVGVEQGGVLAARLVTDIVAPNPDLGRRLVAAYLIETVTPAPAGFDVASVPPCAAPRQTRCLLAWISAPWLDFARVHRIETRSIVWSSKGVLEGLNGRVPLCVNPVLGMATTADAPARLNRGAANASGLEWGARPGFMARQVSARCVDGVLRVSRPRSDSLLPSGGWAERRRAAPYNLFWADLEADAQARAAAWLSADAAAVIPPR
jgi:hypothetical protein